MSGVSKTAANVRC